MKEAQRAQAVRIAELDKEQKIGEQTAAFEREAEVKLAEQRKRVAVADAEAKAIAGEAQSQAEVFVQIFSALGPQGAVLANDLARFLPRMRHDMRVGLAWTDTTTGRNISAWPLVSCSTPR